MAAAISPVALRVSIMAIVTIAALASRFDWGENFQNVCYSEHILLFLHSIICNYGKEYIRKDDAEGTEPKSADHG